MAEVTMYCTHACPYCRMAIALLTKKGAVINRIQVDEQPELRARMTEITGRTSVPQIFIGDRHVGGYTDIVELDMEDELDPLLQA
ncbi:MAG: glutaredoxin 3 [Gammaproteobacteria bacterium]|nr:glutaredoxin 3 [Gammaproteobacteria bacterium]